MSELKKIENAYFAYLSGAEEVNPKIISGFRQYIDDAQTNKTHFFEGRYENIYIEREKIPELSQIIDQAIKYVAEILAIPAQQLQCGFWFNSMNSGDVTLPHTHDDDDELMSGVYYVEVPENSGQLLLGAGDKLEKVDPEAGKMVFFKPDLRHQVSENKSAFHRLSIGMNFGLKDEFKTE
ncbi:MAG: 2OG-Fe(II) oxygenase [Gammaproteobacteria bacterium]|nr:2OG-Fe(II) oxygenase [Gammaproteobacteria bacterium]